MQDLANDPQPPGEARPRLRPGHPLLLIALGVLLMAACGLVDVWRQMQLPWANAALALGEDPPFPKEDAIRVAVRRVPADQFESLVKFAEQSVPADWRGETWEQDLEMLAAWESRTEFVIKAGTDTLPDYETMLAQGRLPKPGEPEVLAGPLVRLDTFEMDGVTFTVTGRIAPRVPAFIDAYLLPAAPRWEAMFEADRGARPGWLKQDVSAWLAEVTTPEETPNTEPLGGANTEALEAMGDDLEAGMAMTERPLTVLGIVALGLVALGSALLATRLAHWLHGLGGPPQVARLMMPLWEAIVERPVLWWGLHVLNYGVMLCMMAVATAHPRMTANLAEWMAMVFSEGDLAYVGAAYASRNIPLAALATFGHNFFTATIMLTILPSLLILGWGIVKTAGSLALVGFIMAPLWVGTFSGYSYHSITMGLEIEAYILATFAITVYAIRFLRGAVLGNFFSDLVMGVRVVAGAIVVVCVLLFTGAVYEAVTLILFRF